MRGQPRAIEYGGQRYRTITAFSSAYGLDPRQVWGRLEGGRPADEHLLDKLHRRAAPLPRTPTSTMYVVTYFGVWRV